MTQTIANKSRKGVICLFCGMSTSLSPQAERRYTAHPGEYRASIVRCRQCGKEAMYLPDEIVDFQVA